MEQNEAISTAFDVASTLCFALPMPYGVVGSGVFQIMGSWWRSSIQKYEKPLVEIVQDVIDASNASMALGLASEKISRYFVQFQTHYEAVVAREPPIEDPTNSSFKDFYKWLHANRNPQETGLGGALNTLGSGSAQIPGFPSYLAAVSMEILAYTTLIHLETIRGGDRKAEVMKELAGLLEHHIKHACETVGMIEQAIWARVGQIQLSKEKRTVNRRTYGSRGAAPFTVVEYTVLVDKGRDKPEEQVVFAAPTNAWAQNGGPQQLEAYTTSVLADLRAKYYRGNLSDGVEGKNKLNETLVSYLKVHSGAILSALEVVLVATFYPRVTEQVWFRELEGNRENHEPGAAHAGQLETFTIASGRTGQGILEFTYHVDDIWSCASEYGVAFNGHLPSDLRFVGGSRQKPAELACKVSMKTGMNELTIMVSSNLHISKVNVYAPDIP